MTHDAEDILTGRWGLVVEDHADTRRWLGEMLMSAYPGIRLAEAATRRAALQWLTTEAPHSAPADKRHIALVDIGLPDGSGIDVVQALARGHDAFIPIVTTIYDDDSRLFEAIAAGAQGYLLKDQHPDSFVQFLVRIDTGEPPLSPAIARRMLAYFGRSPGLGGGSDPDQERLTQREEDVLRLLGRGLRVNEAAAVLGIGRHTVASYVKNIYRKLNITSRAEAAVEAMRRGLL